MFCCLRGCLGGLGGAGAGWGLARPAPTRPWDNPVQLDTSHMGTDSLSSWAPHTLTRGLLRDQRHYREPVVYIVLSNRLRRRRRLKEALAFQDSDYTVIGSGHEVVVVKGGQRVCGSGCALGNAPLVQSKAYFEVKLQQGGVWAVGLAARETDLHRVHGGMDKVSWCLNSDGTVRHDNVELHQLSPARRDSPTELLVDARPAPAGRRSPERDAATVPSEGDVIGVAYDHIELNFFLNGRNMEIPVRTVKGTVFPALYVDDGAILDVILDNFLYPPPAGFERIMIEQSLL